MDINKLNEIGHDTHLVYKIKHPVNSINLINQW